MSWMIYGANGYTGRLLARLAKERGERPVLAGRHAQKVLAVAQELDLEARVFTLENPESTSSQSSLSPKSLEGIDAVVNCAGPFVDTSPLMLTACRMAGTHYLDITGEIEVFENLFAQASRLRDGGITAICGVGFDVVPSDCLAARLKEKFQEGGEATRLTLAFHPGEGKLSPGTTKTALRNIGVGYVRKGGRIIKVSPTHDVRKIPFREPPSPPSLAVTIPWGDVSTAFHSTGIPNVSVYLGTSRSMIKQMRASRWLGPATRVPGVQKILSKLVERKVHGPTAAERDKGEVILYGQVEDAAGRKLAMRMYTPEGYALTVESALAAVLRVRNGDLPKGPLTPSMAFGAGFAETLPGVRIEPAPTLD